MRKYLIFTILILLLMVCFSAGAAEQPVKQEQPKAVSAAPAQVEQPKVPTIADRIAELQKGHEQCVSEIERLTQLKLRIEGGIAELQRLDALAAEKVVKTAEKPAPKAPEKK